MSDAKPQVAIVDYRLGNLFSVKQACEHVGLTAEITNSKSTILAASAAILPGVGAFGDAMQILGQLDLLSVLKDVVNSGRPILGICLGMQLLMTESHEFGRHRGLGWIDGEVKRLPEGHVQGQRLKVPQIGWNRIYPRQSSWSGSMLEHLAQNAFMYFVHSYYAEPASTDVVLSMTRYGSFEFCSSLQKRNIFGCQFHPERSGRSGLWIYQNLASSIRSLQEQHLHD